MRSEVCLIFKKHKWSLISALSIQWAPKLCGGSLLAFVSSKGNSAISNVNFCVCFVNWPRALKFDDLDEQLFLELASLVGHVTTESPKLSQKFKGNNFGLITSRLENERFGRLIHNYKKIWWVIYRHQSYIHCHIIDKIIKIPGAQGGNYRAILCQTTNSSFSRNYVTTRLANVGRLLV